MKTIILIPHYNNTHGLIKTLNSITESHYPDVLVVDDGSEVPPTEADLSAYPGGLSIIYSGRNRGIEHTLNMGLKHILESGQYEFVARLDCGDQCLPNRFHQQSEYLQKNTAVHLLGSHVDFVSESGTHLYTYKVPVDHDEIQKKMFSKNCFIHPAVMFRLSALKSVGHYPTQYKYAEDYAFFFDIVKHFQTANLDQVLVRSESNMDGISRKHRKKQMKSRLEIVRRFAKPNIHFIKGFLYTLSLVWMPETMHYKLKTLYYR